MAQPSNPARPRKGWFAAMRDEFRKPVVIGYYSNIDPRTGRALVAPAAGQALYSLNKRNAVCAATRR